MLVPPVLDADGNVLPELPWWRNSTAVKILYVLSLLVLAGCAYVLTQVLPTHMDEYSHYHRLACTFYPEAQYNYFRESCFAYHMSLPGVTFYMDYSYIGFLDDLLLRPFFYLLRNHNGVFLFGATALLLFAALCCRALKVPLGCALIPLLYFPLLYSLLHDTGTLRFALVSLPLLILLLQTLLKAEKRPAIFTCYFLCAALCALLTWDKVFFLFYFPMYFVIAAGLALGWSDRIDFQVLRRTLRGGTFAGGVSDGERPAAVSGKQHEGLSAIDSVNIASSERGSIKRLIIAALCAAAGPLLYLTLVRYDVGGGRFVPYLDVLTSLSDNLSRGFLSMLRSIVLYLTVPLFYGDRIYSFSIDALLISQLFWLPLCCIGVYALYHHHLLSSPLVLGFACTVLIFLILQNPRYSHHFIILHLPLVLGLMLWAGRSTVMRPFIVASLAAITALSTWQLTQATPMVHSEKGREEVFAWLSQPEQARHSIINFSEWGGYYDQSLFGDKEQLVTYTEPITREQTLVLEEILRTTGRTQILNVCHSCTPQTLAPFYPGYHCETVTFPSSHWKVYRLTPPVSGSTTEAQP